MKTNANTTAADAERLTGEREFLRLERKRMNRARYERRHGRREPRLILVSDIVTVTIGPLTTAYSAIGSDLWL